MLTTPCLLAHEVDADPLPLAPGWHLGAAAAAVVPFADARWPTAVWPGVLTTGIAPPDQRGGVRLEHATIAAAARFDERFGASLAVGLHDRDGAHLEAATLIGRHALGEEVLEARVGRDLVRLGDAIDRAGHYDRFSQTPLAKRGVLDDRWIDDGVVLAWRGYRERGLRDIEAGLWRGRSFPGAAAGPAVPSLRVRLGWEHFDLQLAGVHLQPQARGAAAQSAGASGHSHGPLDCRESLQQRVCFDGTVEVLAASLQWLPDDLPWSVTLAGLSRRERGTMYSTSGSAAQRTRLDGAWLDLVWRPTGYWTLAMRLERLVPDTRLEGTGTAALASEGGLAGGGPVSRATFAVLREVGESLQLSIEAGHERFEAGQVSFIGVRAVWRSARLLAGTW
jgi:hypothetical protein